MTYRKRQPNRDRRGFTLAETLLALLILLLATAVTATGLPVAIRAYHDVVDAANAEVLLSTTMTALRDELGSAEGFALNADDSLDWYKSAGLQGRSVDLKSYDGSGDDGYMGIKIENAGLSRELVSNAAATRRLHAEFSKITYDKINQVFVVSGLQVKKNSNGSVMSEAPSEYLIRPMNPTIIGDSEG